MNNSTIWGIVAVSVPGILVALLTQYLALIYEARVTRRTIANALALLERDRFWANRCADMRSGTFERLGQVVQSILDTSSPIATK